MEIAARNRALKKAVAAAYPGHKVTVRGSRGTAYGWVRLHIAYAPRNTREAQEQRAKVWDVINAAGIQIGTYGSADPGSDYGHGHTIHIDFEHCREPACPYGDEAWKHHMSAADWDAMQEAVAHEESHRAAAAAIEAAPAVVPAWL